MNTIEKDLLLEVIEAVRRSNGHTIIAQHTYIDVNLREKLFEWEREAMIAKAKEDSRIGDLTTTTGEEKEENNPTHIDDFVSYGSIDSLTNLVENEEYARWVLMHFRLPAMMRIQFAPLIEKYKLFCIYEGEKYRVTGASRLGDVWLTRDFSRKVGYEKRVCVDNCSDWSKN